MDRAIRVCHSHEFVDTTKIRLFFSDTAKGKHKKLPHEEIFPLLVAI